ncbi:MAG TPA: hypothetical protein VMB27_20660 [Solirubrobacteraceae bacterium]|nr:hypothetical protein [Solirubrobacteraceae bacterium]
MCAGAVTVGGLRAPFAPTVKVAGRRTSDGGVEVVLGAVGGFVSGAVGGVPVAVSGAVWVVAVEVVAAVDFELDAFPDPDDPHPTAVPSNTTHKRTANPLTFAG